MKSSKLVEILRCVCSTTIRIYALAGVLLSGYFITNTVRDLIFDDPEFVIIASGNRMLWEIQTAPLSWGKWGKIENFNAQIRDWIMEGPTPREQIEKQVNEVRDQRDRGDIDYQEAYKRFDAIRERINNKYPPDREGFAKSWPGSWRNWIILGGKNPFVLGIPVVALLILLILPAPPGQSKLPEGAPLGSRVVHWLIPIGADRVLMMGAHMNWGWFRGVVGFSIFAAFASIVFSFTFNIFIPSFPWIGIKEYLLFSGYAFLPLALLKLASPEIGLFGYQFAYVKRTTWYEITTENHGRYRH